MLILKIMNTAQASSNLMQSWRIKEIALGKTCIILAIIRTCGNLVKNSSNAISTYAIMDRMTVSTVSKVSLIRDGESTEDDIARASVTPWLLFAILG